MTRSRTVIDLRFLLAPLFLMCALPAGLILALIVGQIVIYGGW